VAGYRFATFLSDYGLRDGFVAVCRATLLERAPDVRLVDLTHLVPPQDVRRGAAVLALCVPDLPPAVHLAIVDPGVGGPRRPVAIRAGRSLLVGPDNGLLPAGADALGGPAAAVELNNPEWHRHPVSATFHGRDIFAPAAGRLAAGAPLSEAGRTVDPASLVRLPAPLCRIEPGRLTAEVVDVDGFGNAALAADADAAARAGLRPGDRVRLTARKAEPAGQAPGEAAAEAAGEAAGEAAAEAAGEAAAVETTFGTTFTDVDVGLALIYVDSGGRLAVAVRDGSAAERVGLATGDRVVLVPR
jgi:S-adenosylmethionine hydrolase